MGTSTAIENVVTRNKSQRLTANSQWLIKIKSHEIYKAVNYTYIYFLVCFGYVFHIHEARRKQYAVDNTWRVCLVFISQIFVSAQEFA